MFTKSSQKQEWMFSDEMDLNYLREKANSQYIEYHGRNLTVWLFIYIQISKNGIKFIVLILIKNLSICRQW